MCSDDNDVPRPFPLTTWTARPRRAPGVGCRGGYWRAMCGPRSISWAAAPRHRSRARSTRMSAGLWLGPSAPWDKRHRAHGLGAVRRARGEHGGARTGWLDRIGRDWIGLDWASSFRLKVPAASSYNLIVQSDPNHPLCALTVARARSPPHAHTVRALRRPPPEVAHGERANLWSPGAPLLCSGRAASGVPLPWRLAHRQASTRSAGTRGRLRRRGWQHSSSIHKYTLPHTNTRRRTHTRTQARLLPP